MRDERQTPILRRGLIAIPLALAVLVTACGGPAVNTGKPDDRLSVDTPSAQGQLDTLKWGLPYGEPNTLDPSKVGDYSPGAVVANLCEGLVGLSADFSIQPGLAEKVSRPDERTIVYDIRPGVKFTNGEPLTAEDVVYSLRRNTDPNVQSVWANYYETVDSIKQTGPMQVTVSFVKPAPLFEQWMSTAGGFISQKSYVENAGKDYGTPTGGVMCTGPYSLTSWKGGESITLARNDHYWETKRLAKAKSVVFTFVSDPSTLASALASGELDGAYEVPVGSRDALISSGAGTLYSGPSTQMIELIPTERNGPMANLEVRQALNLAIDKAALAKNVYGGSADTLKTFIPPFAWGEGENRPIFQKGYDDLPGSDTPDIKAAAALVEKANLTDKSFTVAVGAGDQAGLQTLTFVQAAAKEIGLDMTIKQVQPAEYSDMFYNGARRADLDLLYALGYMEVANPLDYAPHFAIKGGLFNWTGYDDPKVANLLNDGLSDVNPTAAARKFVEAQAIYTPQMLAIPLVSPREGVFMNKRISGAPASFAYLSMPWAAMIGATS